MMVATLSEGVVDCGSMVTSSNVFHDSVVVATARSAGSLYSVVVVVVLVGLVVVLVLGIEVAALAVVVLLVSNTNSALIHSVSSSWSEKLYVCPADCCLSSW